MPASSLLNATRDEARVNELLARVAEKLGHIPQAYHTLATSQSYLNDTLYNLKKTIADGELDLHTKHLIAVATASIAGSASLVETRILEARKDGIGDDAIGEAITVAASTTQYNTFYKFQSLAGSGFEEFKPGYKLSVYLRPNVLTLRQVELIAAMISVINNCTSCVKGHVAKCRELGITLQQIEEGLRVAALIAGVGAFTRID
ncbi:MAG TPA: carboxymuconolactone decarboxylase family protein [Candidatus Kapabacteria bacterium]|nr:carboxymuconolactone decarboxylase family protein [Candidatus Kapabacteria bacterium]